MIPLTYDKRLVDLAELDGTKGEMHGSCRYRARSRNIQLAKPSIGSATRLRTSIDGEGRTTKVESKRDTVRADRDATPHAIVVVDFKPFVVKFVCGSK